MSTAPTIEKQDVGTDINPTTHLFHRPCQPGNMKTAYCGFKLSGNGSPWNGEAVYETCVVCLDIRAVACPVCGVKP